MTRPPRNVFRKASFKARIFARLALLSSFPVSVLRTLTSVALPAHQPCAGERDRGFPSSPLILSRRCRVGLDRPRPGLDRPRLAATDRDRARRRDITHCRGLLGGDEADAAVAILALADFPEPVVRTQLIEPVHKLGRRQGFTTPGGVVGRERFRKASRCSRQARSARQDNRSPIPALYLVVRDRDCQPRSSRRRRQVRSSPQAARKARGRHREVRASRAISASSSACGSAAFVAPHSRSCRA